MTPVITAPSPAPARQPAQGHCSECGKIWRLTERQGVCQWCSKPASCQTTRTKPRRFQCSRRRKQRQAENHNNGYDQLPDQQGWIATADGFRWTAVPWATFYRIAARFAVKAISGEKDDLLHTIMEALAAVHRRKLSRGQDFTEPAMYRTAQHVKDWYWYKRYAYSNGLDCRNCTKQQRDTCRYNWAWADWQYCDCHRAIQLESINEPITDENGNLTELSNLIADDNALDMEAWQDAKTWLLGAPIRLKMIAMKRRDGEKLTHAERQYLSKLRKRRQLSLARG